MKWGGSDRTTEFISSTELHATLTNADLDDAGTFNVTVANPTPGGGSSTCATFPTVDATCQFTVNSVGGVTLAIQSITVTAGVALSGTAGTTVSSINVTGTGFEGSPNPQTTVKLSKNSFDINCTGFTFASASSLTGGSCVIPPTAETGVWTVTVTNPRNLATDDCDGGDSDCTFTVNAAGLAVTRVRPNYVYKDSGVAATQPILAVYGSGFTSDSVVRLKQGAGFFACTSFTFVNSTLLTNGTCNASTASNGNWTIEVDNGGGNTAASSCATQGIATGCIVVAATNTFTTCVTNPNASFYWVGGTGDWNSLTTPHWATTSTGSASATNIPCATSDLYFTANSDSGSAVTVTLNAPTLPGDNLAQSINFRGIDQNVTFSSSNPLTISASLNLADSNGKTVNINSTGLLKFDSVSAGEAISLDGDTLPSHITFAPSSGTVASWTLVDDFTTTDLVTGSTQVTTLSGGTLDTNNNDVSVGTMVVSGAGSTLKLGTSLVSLIATGTSITPWNFASASTLSGDSSTITVNGAITTTATFSGGGKTYKNINFDNTITGAVSFNTDTTGSTFNDVHFGNTGAVTYSLTGGGITARQVTFNNGNSNVTVNGGNTFNGVVTKCLNPSPDTDISANCTSSTGTLTLSNNTNTFYGALTANNTGATSIASNNTFVGAVTIGGNATITGASGSPNTFSDSVTITGTLNLSSYNTFNSALTVSGTTLNCSTSTAAVCIVGNNDFNGAVTLAGNTKITGSSNTFDSTLSVTGASSTFTVSAGQTNSFTHTGTGVNCGASGTANVCIGGATSSVSLAAGNTFSGSLKVVGTGASTMTSGNTFNGAVLIGGNMTITKASSSAINDFNSTFETTGSGNLSLQGTSTSGNANEFSGQVIVAGALAMGTDADANQFGVLTVTGSAASTISDSNNFTGAVSFGGGVSIASGNSFGSTLGAAAASTITGDGNTFTGRVTISTTAGTLDMTGGDDNNFDATPISLTVAGTGASVISTSNDFDGSVSLDGPVTVQGYGNNPSAAHCTSDTTYKNLFTGTFTTTGSGDNLVIDGSCNTFTGAVSVGGVLTMNANKTRTTFSSTLAVTGTGTSAINDNNVFMNTANFSGTGSSLITVGSGNDFQNTLTVAGTGTSTIAGTSGSPNDFDAAVSFGGNVTITGSSNTFDTTFTTTGSGSLTINSGQTGNIFTGAATIAGTINLVSTSASTFSNNLTAAGTGSGSIINSGNTFNGVVTISGASPTVNGPNTWGASSTLSLNGTGTAVISGASTFKNLNRTASASVNDNGITFPASTTQTISGTLTLAGADGATRLFVSSATSGTRAVLSAAAVSLSNVDFKDIDADGAAIPFTGTSLGNGGNNLDITFSGSTTRYWKLNGDTGNFSDGSKWSNSSGGSACTCVPLPQDLAKFDASSFSTTGKTVTIDTIRLPAIDFTGATNSPTLAFGSTARTIFGSTTDDATILTLISGMSVSGSGTLTFGNTSVRKTITSGGKTLTMPIIMNASGGTITFQDAFNNSTNDITLTAGTIAANDIAVTTSKVTTASGTTLTMGSGTWTVTGTGTGASAPWNIDGATLTSGAGGKITMSGSGNKDFVGGGKTCVGTCTTRYRDLEITGSGTTAIDNSNRFNTISSTAGALTFGSSSANASTVDSTFSYTGNTSSVTLNGSNTYTGTMTISGTSTTATVAHGGNTWSAGANFANTGATSISGSVTGSRNTFTGAFNAAGNLTLNGDFNIFSSSVAVTGTANIAGSNNQFNGTALVSCTGSPSDQASVCMGGDTTITGNTNTFAAKFGTTGSAGLIFTASTADTNTFTGVVTVAGALTMGSGADTNHFNDTTTALAVGTGASSISASNTFEGDISFGGTTTINGANNDFGNDTGDSFSIGSGAGNLVFTATDADTNEFRGAVSINNGVITMNSGADSNEFESSLTASTSTSASTLSSSNTFTGAVSLAGNVTIGSTNTFSNTFAASGTGASSVVATNDFRGTMSFGGNLSITGATNLFGNDSGDSFTTTGSGSLIFSGSGADTNTFPGIVTVAGVLTMNSGSDGNHFDNTTNPIIVSGIGSSSISASNVFGSGTSGPVSFTMTSNNGLSIAGSNTFAGNVSVTTATGALTISAGSNVFSSNLAFATSGGSFSVTGNNTFKDFTISGSSLAASSFGAVNTFREFTYGGSGTGAITFTDSNTFCSFTMTNASAKTTTFGAGKTQTLTNQTSGTPDCTAVAVGSRGKITVNGVSALSRSVWGSTTTSVANITAPSAVAPAFTFLSATYINAAGPTFACPITPAAAGCDPISSVSLTGHNTGTWTW